MASDTSFHPGFWENTFPTLPEALQRSLLMGSSGLLHLLEMSEQTFALVPAAQDPALRQNLLSLGSGMLLSGFEADPLNLAFATQIQMVEKVYKFAPSGLVPIMAWLSRAYKAPSDQRYLMRLLEHREVEKIERYLADQMQKEPENAFWLHHAFSFGIAENRLDWIEERIARFKELPPALRAFLSGGVAYADGRWTQAAGLFEEACSKLELGTWQEQLAQSLCNAGDTETAAGIFRKALEGRFWKTNSLLRLYDLQSGIANRMEAPKGKGAILFYTWNKDVHLDQAL